MSKRQRIEALELDTAELHAAQHNSAKLIGYLEGRVKALEQAGKVQPVPVTPAKPGRWKPKNGAMYWMTNCDGPLCMTWSSSRSDENLWALGRCLPTEAAAQYAYDRAVALQAMHDWADARFVPDWGDSSQEKWQLEYYHHTQTWDTSATCARSKQSNDWPVFASHEDRAEFMAEFGDHMHFLLERTKP